MPANVNGALISNVPLTAVTGVLPPVLVSVPPFPLIVSPVDPPLALVTDIAPAVSELFRDRLRVVSVIVVGLPAPFVKLLPDRIESTLPSIGVASEIEGAEIDPAVILAPEPVVLTENVVLALPAIAPVIYACDTCTAPFVEVNETPVPDRLPVEPVTETAPGAVTESVPLELTLPALLTVAAFKVRLPAELTAVPEPTTFMAPEDPDADTSRVTAPPVN